MFQLDSVPTKNKSLLYQHLTEQTKSLLSGEHDFIANAANLSALLYHSLPEINWAGFYFHKQGELVLGPFQGKPACIRIPLGKGVCGTAAMQRQAIIVPDVHQFPGHIACDSASNAEIVIPLIHKNRLLGVLDVDSPSLGRFDEEDRIGLQALLVIFLHTSRLPDEIS